MKKIASITYDIKGRKEIEATTKALLNLEKAIKALKKVGITLNVKVNENYIAKNKGK